eukprot:m.242681 g.242681  ORF g.242681 m.242681 type:complete len:420 (+) comp14084_c0_seq1:49-1308(+)
MAGLLRLSFGHVRSVTSKASKARRVFVVGVGMTKFEKPGSKQGWDYPAMVKEAGEAALADSHLKFSSVQQAYVGYVFGESTSGNRATYELGLDGIPIVNVNNNCSTGSTALYLARQAVAGGGVECVAAIGFEKMQKGSLAFGQSDRESPVQRHLEVCGNINPLPPKTPAAPYMFGAAGEEHMKKYGTKKEHFAKIASKNHNHSVNNPYAQFRNPATVEEVLASPAVYGPLTRLQCSPTSDGAAVAILASEDFVKKHGLQRTAVEIVGQAMATDTLCSFEKSAIDACGSDMTKRASAQALAQAGVGIGDVQVIELHDCFSTNELLTYEGLGMCPVGKGGDLVDANDNTYGGKWVVNPSGGLISKGHPLGATGIAQCAELCWQLRGEAGNRQVHGAKVGLQHNLGLGGAAVVTVYRKAFNN